MKPIYNLALLVFIFYSGNQCIAQTNSLQKINDSITSLSNIYFNAFANDEVSLLENMHTKDSWIMPSAGAAFCGPNAASEFFTKTYEQQKIRNGKLIINDLYGDPETIIEEGFYQFLSIRSEAIENGTFLIIWKKTSGGWKIYRSSFHNHIKN